jgi:chromate transporter
LASGGGIAGVRAPVPFAEAVRVWARIGVLGFGGPAGQIALMHRILVEERRWIGEARLLHALNFCMLLPGPEAQQLATYVGWLLHGIRGGIVAGMLFVLPGFFVLLALSAGYALLHGTGAIDVLFFGLKAAVLAIVLQALLRVARRALATRAMWVLAAAAFVAIFAFHVDFPLIVLAAAIVGLVGGRLRPHWFPAGGGHGGAEAAAEADDSHLRHVAPSWRGSLATVLVWGGLWAAPIVAVLALLGADSVLLAIAGLFSKLAVVTFGGAYAVLAYVAQEAVTSYGWLRPGEMLDGLAMAETTPGPLILVLVFVGYLAAFRDPGGLSALASGVAGAVLTTWVTFVPCFLWIFLGAPFVERLRGHRGAARALSAITAAVVGVILNLAAWFALNTLFAEVGTFAAGPIALPAPVFPSFDPAAAVLAAGAIVAMFRFRVGTLVTLGATACLGAAWRLLA